MEKLCNFVELIEARMVSLINFLSSNAWFLYRTLVESKLNYRKQVGKRASGMKGFLYFL